MLPSLILIASMFSLTRLLPCHPGVPVVSLVIWAFAEGGGLCRWLQPLYSYWCPLLPHNAYAKLQPGRWVLWSTSVRCQGQQCCWLPASAGERNKGLLVFLKYKSLILMVRGWSGGLTWGKALSRQYGLWMWGLFFLPWDEFKFRNRDEVANGERAAAVDVAEAYLTIWKWEKSSLWIPL